jgi:orotate phosphoribosyltransferase
MQKIPYKTDQNNPAIRAYKEAVEKGKKNQHVLRYGEKWAVSDLASGKVSHIFSDAHDAAEYAKEHAAVGTAVFIHGSDGRIIERKDY